MLTRRATVIGLLALVGLGSAAVLAATEADAKATWDSPYSLEQTYNAATRLVRVDLGLKITERDPQAAYLMFEYKSVEGGKKTTPGAIEMTPSGSGAVKVVVRLEQMPRYHEQVMVDHLARKMREEYGEPPPRPKPIPSEDDAGAPDAPED